MVHARLAGPAYQVEITAGGHPLLADEPKANGGADTGPAPFDLVLSGLAACTLITLRMYAERKGWTGFSLSGRFRLRMRTAAPDRPRARGDRRAGRRRPGAPRRDRREDAGDPGVEVRLHHIDGTGRGGEREDLR